jgi:hypothetical protein
LGAAGLAAPVSAGFSTSNGWPSSFADWTVASPSGTIQSQMYNQYAGTGQIIWPMCTFSYVFLRKDMTAYGESGRLATALVKFMFSADAGTPTDFATTPETPTSPIKFYGDLIMAQPPSAVITQALSDISLIQFSASAPQDWGFESYWTKSGNPVATASSTGTPTGGYIQYQGFGDRIFSVWRSDYFDYKITVNAQSIAANAAGITKNFLAINNNVAAIQANALTIANNVATLQALSTTQSTMQSTITSQAATIASLQSQITTLSNALGVSNGTVTVNTVGSSSTTTSSTTTSVATAAIVVAAVGVLLSLLLGCYVIYLRPKNVAEGNKMAVSMAPLGRSTEYPTPASV